jgi:hypothetical protein
MRFSWFAIIENSGKDLCHGGRKSFFNLKIKRLNDKCRESIQG